MSQEFVERVTDGFGEGHYKVDLRDHVIVLCEDAFKFEGELLGFCPEGLLLGCDGADIWVKADSIIGVLRSNPGRGGGGDREEFVSPEPPAKKQKSEQTGSEAMRKVFCNGTR